MGTCFVGPGNFANIFGSTADFKIFQQAAHPIEKSRKTITDPDF